jgi:hypothetical protein
VFKECRPLRVPQKDPTYLTKAEFLSPVGLVKEVELRDLIAFTVATMSPVVRELLVSRKRESGYVFRQPNGEKFRGTYVSHRFKEYAQLVGLSEGIHFLSLRHTGTTWLVQRDIPLYSVQKLLDHHRRSPPKSTRICLTPASKEQ